MTMNNNLVNPTSSAHLHEDNFESILCSSWLSSNELRSPTWDKSSNRSLPSLSAVSRKSAGVLDRFLPSLMSGSVNPSKEMEASVWAVEAIIGYQFKNKRLLEEALTHSSCAESTSYQRLEFLGDAALSLVVSNYVFSSYPDLDPGQLSLIRAANISTEKFARVAIRLGLFKYVRCNAAALDEKVREFELAVQDEDDAVTYGGSVKAPKVLADIVESVAAAIYVDCKFDLQILWVVFRRLLEPIVTLEDLQLQPQPVTMLFELCQQKGQRVDIKRCRKGKTNIFNVFVDGKFLAAGSTECKDTAKLYAARGALDKLPQSMVNEEIAENCRVFDGRYEIDGAKQRLNELCGNKKWPKPIYKIEEVGHAPERKFLCSIEIQTADGKLLMMGDTKCRIKDAENSAASLMLQGLDEKSEFSKSSTCRIF